MQKLAAANSNTATRHILQAGLFLTAEVAECLSLRISDIIEYSPTKNAFIQSIGVHNVATLEEMSNLHLYDFGIFLELAPDEEEKQLLENNIQVALSKENIELEDAIDLRDIRNTKLANQVLKIRRKKKFERDQLAQKQLAEAQAQAQAQAQTQVAQAEVQKQQQLTQSQIELENAKAQLKGANLDKEAQVKMVLMDHEFELNLKLRELDMQAAREDGGMKEDRKDQRTKLQAGQQSQLIDQRKTGAPPKDFESSGNDVLSGNFGLGNFEPR